MGGLAGWLLACLDQGCAVQPQFPPGLAIREKLAHRKGIVPLTFTLECAQTCYILHTATLYGRLRKAFQSKTHLPKINSDSLRRTREIVAHPCRKTRCTGERFLSAASHAASLAKVLAIQGKPCGYVSEPRTDRVQSASKSSGSNHPERPREINFRGAGKGLM